MNKEKKFAELWQYIETHKPSIENALRENLPIAPTHIEKQFNEALEFAILTDEIRIHPFLTLLGAELVGGNADNVLPSAVAVEYIHTSSLIFDGLLKVKNVQAEFEKTPLNEKFGEGLAILVGLGLLNAAYPLVFVNHSGVPELALAAHAEIVECVGAAGLVGGQSVDLAQVIGSSRNEVYGFESIKNSKTSALMRLALRIGAILSGSNYIELANLSRFAELLGDTNQLNDDLNISERNEDTLKIKLSSTIEEAKRVLVENFQSNEARSCLIQLTEFLAERKLSTHIQ